MVVYHVWYCEGRRIIEEYKNMATALEQHKAATKEGIRSYLTFYHPDKE